MHLLFSSLWLGAGLAGAAVTKTTDRVPPILHSIASEGAGGGGEPGREAGGGGLFHSAEPSDMCRLVSGCWVCLYRNARRQRKESAFEE